MNTAQAHRGPDGEGFETFSVPGGSLVLGHRRLAIQDLSPAGRQPMQNPRTGDWIVFNGELYNHPELRKELENNGAVFHSRADTEAILYAFERWGTNCFEYLHGMFAFAIYERARHRIILARDPLGIKPLYWAWGGDAFLFASEAKAIKASGLLQGSADRRAIAAILAYGAAQGPLTVWEGVRLLSPGAWAAVDLASAPQVGAALSENVYWTFPDRTPDAPSPTDASEVILERLSSAVQSHLIGDVPIGVFLSSGLDSSALTALAGRIRHGDLDTFTVALADSPEQDENPVAEATARALGVRHHQIMLTEKEVLRSTTRWLDSIDQPSVDGLNTFIISGAVRQRNIVVALSGLGGDEIFAGYSSFRDVPRLSRWVRAAGYLPRPVRAALAQMKYITDSRVRRQKAVEMAKSDGSLTDLYFHRRRLFSDRDLLRFGFRADELNLDKNLLPPECQPRRGLPPDDPVASVAILESRFYMGNMLLRDSDVFGMSHGLEIRVPLLDRRIADYVLSLPGPLRLSRNGPNKPLLAGALGSLLPPELLTRKKRGFSLPQARWMQGPLRETFADSIHLLRRAGWLDSRAVVAVWNDFKADKGGPSWSRAWILGVLGYWCSKHCA